MMRTVASLLTAAALTTSCSGNAMLPRAGTAAPETPTSASPSPVATDPSPMTRLKRDAFSGRLVEVAVLQQPLAMAVRPGDDALYFAQKTGEVMRVEDGIVTPKPVLDLSSRVSQGGEQGLLGIAFSPRGELLFANYTDPAGDTRIVEYRMEGSRALPGSARELLAVDQPYSNHNGGHLLFGPDGHLYIGLGDGGSGGDPEDRAQDLGTELGKILRVAPEGAGSRPYDVPVDNPFVDRAGAVPSIWAYGLRNPWRFSFDRATGDLWIADVGQDAVEEINRYPAGSPPGPNFGWDGFEGTRVFEPPTPEDAVMPVYEYGRDLGQTVIGGFVYRGSAIPELQGAYVFGDYYHPELRALVPGTEGVRHVPLGILVSGLVAFGEDADGELYALSLEGPVYRIAP